MTSGIMMIAIAMMSFASLSVISVFISLLPLSDRLPIVQPLLLLLRGMFLTEERCHGWMKPMTAVSEVFRVLLQN